MNKDEIRDRFNIEFELIKKQTHDSLNDLFDRYTNAKDWKVDFEFDWGVSNSSSINKDDKGWYDQLVEKRDVKGRQDE